ncbi:MAG: SDR family NAD(P)-dependent oxidoreductase [Azospirillaceae bacterium]
MTYRCALVTGATSGIGAAFVHALPPETGLVLTGRDEAALAAAATRAGRRGQSVETVPADLTVPAEREAVIAHAKAAGIDLFVNNAGMGALGAILDRPAEEQSATIELNVVAMAELTRALLPGMIARARNDGSRAGLIVVSSALAASPLPFFATYAASKAFSLWYAEALAEEVRGQPVDVLALCPGPTRSAFGARAGFSAGGLPGALDADAVAKRGLAALGKRNVLVTGRFTPALMEPFVTSHRLLSRGLGGVMRPFARRFGREA